MAVTEGGQNGNGNLFGLVLNAVESDVNSDVLATPSILALDNEEASFLSVQEIPVTTGEVLSADNSKNCCSSVAFHSESSFSSSAAATLVAAMRACSFGRAVSRLITSGDGESLSDSDNRAKRSIDDCAIKFSMSRISAFGSFELAVSESVR